MLLKLKCSRTGSAIDETIKARFEVLDVKSSETANLHGFTFEAVPFSQDDESVSTTSNKEDQSTTNNQIRVATG